MGEAGKATRQEAPGAEISGGVVSWFGGALASESQFVNDMILDPDGTILLTGSIGSGMNVTDLFLMKFEERQEK